MALSGGQTLPPGITFHPSDHELLHSFLRPRIRGHFPSTEFVHDADVYAADPAKLTARYLPPPAGNGKKVWYFFTSVRAKNCRGMRKARAIGTGAGGWHSEAAPKPVLDDDRRRVGHRQSFSFMDKNGRRLGWVMAEFGLDQEEEEGSPVMVVCKVYRSPRASRAETSASTSASLSGQKRKATVEHSDAGTPARRLLSHPMAAAAAPQTERAGSLEDEDEDTSGILKILEEALMSDEPDMLQCAETAGSLTEEVAIEHPGVLQILEEALMSEEPEMPHCPETGDSWTEGDVAEYGSLLELVMADVPDMPQADISSTASRGEDLIETPMANEGNSAGFVPGTSDEQSMSAPALGPEHSLSWWLSWTSSPCGEDFTMFMQQDFTGCSSLLDVF